MPRPMWAGSISFGLVNIPVQLYPAESKKELSFRMLDRRDLAPIREQRVNKLTGKKVPWDDVVKGYRYEEDLYVVLTEEEIRSANIKATQTLEILAFVDEKEIDPVYYDKPYYVEPLPTSRKAYKILAQTLQDTGRAGIARLVLRTREHLTALVARGPLLIAILLRFAHELRDTAKVDVPKESLGELGITEKELSMARQLVEAMSDVWKPEQYRDEYREELLKLIQTKARTGEIHVVEEAPEALAPKAEVLDIAELLRRSMQRAKRAKPARRGA